MSMNVSNHIEEAVKLAEEASGSTSRKYWS